MIDYNDPDTLAMISSGDSWVSWGSRFGWELLGFSYDEFAQFQGANGETITVTRYMRDSINAVIGDR